MSVTFQAISWNTMDSEEKTEKFTVQIFGKTADGESVAAFVKGFTPSFCIQFAEKISTPRHYKDFTNFLKKKSLIVWQKAGDSFEEVMNLSDDLIDTEDKIIYRKSLWGFEFGKETPFFNMHFSSNAAYKKIMYLIRSCQQNTLGVSEMKKFCKKLGEIKDEDKDREYETKYDYMKTFSEYSKVPYQCLKFISNLDKEGLPLEFAQGKLFEVIDPVLRFAHLKNIKMASWIEVTDFYEREEDDKQTTCKLEFECEYSSLEPVQNDQICKFIKEMAFDIECFEPDDKFPDANLQEDPVFQIGITFKNYSDKVARRILLHYHKTAPCKKIPENIVCVRSISENLPELCKYKECKERGHLLESVPTIVENFKTERELLLRFSALIIEEDPDFIYTYNGDMFDWNYLMIRAERNNCYSDFRMLSKLTDYECRVEEKKFTSSAYGDNAYLRVEIPGRLNVDLMIWIQRNMPADRYPSYSLNTVAKIEIDQKKRDIDYKEIFKAFRENDSDLLTRIGDYCCQDTILVQNLVVKLDVVTQMFEMANITHVPASYLMQKGQQIKVFSVICKDAMTKGFLVPLLDLHDDSGFTGAIVLDAKSGLYKSPVAVLDFASLYPSIQVAYMICYTTIVLLVNLQMRLKTMKSKNEPLEIEGIKFDFIEWDDTVIVEIKTGKKFNSSEHAKKVLGISKKDILSDLNGPKTKFRYETKHHLNFFAQNTDSVIPDIQVRLKVSRKNVRKDMGIIEFSENPDEQLRYRVLNGRQLAIKVVMNSIYGFTSAYMLHLSALSASVTAKGRQMIGLTKNFMENEFEKICEQNVWTELDCKTYYNESGREVVTDTPKENWHLKFPSAICGKPWIEKSLNLRVIGGDSVTGDTPILCKKPNGTLTYRTIQFLGEGRWEGRIDGKEYQKCNLQVWSDKGFTDVKWIIRHKTEKKMYRVNTVSGLVDVTEDHSLLDPNGEKMKPSEVSVGSKLLHSSFLPVSSEIPVDFDEEYAFALGLFYADGSCGKYFCKSGTKNSWAINNQNIDLLNRVKAALEKVHPDLSFVILDTMKSSSVYKLIPKSNGVDGGVVKIVDKFRDYMYDEDKYKKVPDFILNANDPIKYGFLQGYYSGDGYYSDMKNCALECSNKGKIGAAGLCHLFSTLGYTVTIDCRPDKPEIFRLRSFTRREGLKHNLIINRSTSYEGESLLPDGRNPTKISNIGVTLRTLDEIRKIEELPKTSQYVYDIETGNHHFHVGPGTMIVHNTDSVFTHFPNSSLEETISLNHKAEVILTDKVFNRHPIEMEYEKCYWPYLLVKKKNYAGVKYEMDRCRWKIDYKGIAPKRRNYCPFTKNVYWDVLYPTLGVVKIDGKLTLSEQSLPKALTSLNDNLSKLIRLSEKPEKEVTNVEFFDDFLISASLKSSYKQENLPHVQLAKRMKNRDECSAPKSGQRFNYVVVRDLNRSDDISSKTEDPLFAFEKKLPLDYIFYLENQIKKPVTKIMNLIGLETENENIFKKINDALQANLKKKIQMRATEAKKRFFSGEPMQPIGMKQKVVKRRKKEMGNSTIDSFFKKLDPKK